MERVIGSKLKWKTRDDKALYAPPPAPLPPRPLTDTVFTILAQFLRYNPRTESGLCRPPTFRGVEPR